MKPCTIVSPCFIKKSLIADFLLIPLRSPGLVHSALFPFNWDMVFAFNPRILRKIGLIRYVYFSKSSGKSRTLFRNYQPKQSEVCSLFDESQRWIFRQSSIQLNHFFLLMVRQNCVEKLPLSTYFFSWIVDLTKFVTES